MLIVPVIDIMDGRVVRAVAGDRAAYRPIETPLAKGTSDPAAIARSLVAAVPGCDLIYVADLDGIVRGMPQIEMVTALAAALPACWLMVDNGLSRQEDAGRWSQSRTVVPVIGTEALADADELTEFSRVAGRSFVLSLDHRAEERIGPAAVFEDAGAWPDTVIVMELSRVGTGTGPDLDRLARVKGMAGGRQVLAAGGVRGIADLRAVADVGCGVLVASALHSGALSAAEVARASRW